MNSKSRKKENSNVNAVNSIDEAVKFDELLIEYSKKHAIEHPSYLSLANCWERIKNVEQGGKIFSSVFDIKLTFVLLNYDTVEIEKAYSNMKKSFDIALPIVSQPLENFFARADLHRSANSYIFRYRAIFDKLMGLIVLLHAPDNYKMFLEAPSRKNEFKKIALKLPSIFTEDSVNNLIKSITIFDDGYRTSEAHYSGRLRKYSFNFDDKSAEYFGKLQLDSWNYLIDVIRKIDTNIG